MGKRQPALDRPGERGCETGACARTVAREWSCPRCPVEYGTAHHPAHPTRARASPKGHLYSFDCVFFLGTGNIRVCDAVPSSTAVRGALRRSPTDDHEHSTVAPTNAAFRSLRCELALRCQLALRLPASNVHGRRWSPIGRQRGWTSIVRELDLATTHLYAGRPHRLRGTAVSGDAPSWDIGRRKPFHAPMTAAHRLA